MGRGSARGATSGDRAPHVGLGIGRLVAPMAKDVQCAWGYRHLYRSEQMGRPLFAVLILGTTGCFGMGVEMIRPAQRELQPVPAAESPKPPGEGGWNCVQYRSNRGDSSSRCLRTLDECRSTAARLEHGSHGGSTSNPIYYRAGMCTAQRAAFCRYIWFNASSGEHQCYLVMEDCKAAQDELTAAAGVGYAKHSQCASYD
jgi:hypothetical protein